MINLLLLVIINNFCSAISYRRVQKEKGNDELSCTVLVARYGPRTSCQRKRLKLKKHFKLLNEFRRKKRTAIKKKKKKKTRIPTKSASTGKKNYERQRATSKISNYDVNSQQAVINVELDNNERTL